MNKRTEEVVNVFREAAAAYPSSSQTQTLRSFLQQTADALQDQGQIVDFICNRKNGTDPILDVAVKMPPGNNGWTYFTIR